jgi:hypothetical protein
LLRATKLLPDENRGPVADADIGAKA